MKVGSVVKIMQRTWDPLVDLVVENLQNPCKAELQLRLRAVETGKCIDCRKTNLYLSSRHLMVQSAETY